MCMERCGWSRYFGSDDSSVHQGAPVKNNRRHGPGITLSSRRCVLLASWIYVEDTEEGTRFEWYDSGKMKMQMPVYNGSAHGKVLGGTNLGNPSSSASLTEDGA